MSEFDKIIGYKDVKAELVRICDIVKNADKYKERGVSLPCGLILDGEPGVGKTLMANCFVKESGRKAFVCRKNKPGGEFVKEIGDVFAKAVENAPSIIFLDDLDKFANADERHRNTEEYVTIQSCIDETRGRDIFVVATTNGTDNLPFSLVRAGRLCVLKITAPQGDDVYEIVKYYLSKKKHNANINIDDIARLLNGESCATLEMVLDMAGQYSCFANKKEIDADDLMRAFLRVVYNAPESTTPRNRAVLEHVAYHEAGHAVVAEVLEEGSVDLVSVRNNTGITWGFTVYRNYNDYSVSQARMENRIIALLAGKASIELVFGKVDMCADRDLRRAFELVESLHNEFCAYGFGYNDGPVTSPFRLLRKEDRITAELELYYARAKKILVENRGFLETLAQCLIKKDTLISSEIQKIRKQF